MHMLIAHGLGALHQLSKYSTPGGSLICGGQLVNLKKLCVLMLGQKAYHGRLAVRSQHDRVYPNPDCKLMKGKPLLGAESEDDSDDPDLADNCCELAMVEGQTCSIPYELYDLPDLKEILSLDTWNSYLTEEERFSLAAFLPDMDQQTFCQTLNDLFSGTDLFFGNPVDIFFKRLKGGLYPPQVVRLRELLQLLQRRKYYLSLSSYHDQMSEMFVSIKRLWDQCDRGVGIDERLNIWKTMRKGRDYSLLDLNSVPIDGYLVSKDLENDRLGHLSAKLKTFKSFRGTTSSPFPSALKMKTYSNGFLSHNLNQKMLGRDGKEYRDVPKGLLKVVPRVPSVNSEHHEMLFGRPEPASAGARNFQDRKFPFLPISSYSGDAFGINRWPSLSPKIDSNEASRTLVPGSEKITKRNFEVPDFMEHDFFPHCMEGVSGEGYKSLQDTTALRRYGNRQENMWKFLDLGNDGYLGRSIESYQFHGHNPGEQQANNSQNDFLTCPSVRQDVSEMSGIGDGSGETPFCKKMEYPSNVKVEKPVHSGKSSLSKGPKDDFRLLLTYKRRKALAKD